MISRRAIFATFVLAGACCLPLRAQTPPDKEATMPQVLQFGLGPGGTALPDDGSEYCGPTSMTMNIAWLGLAGHERLAPTSSAGQTQDFFINLDRTLGGLSQADAYEGTSVNGLVDGVKLYLRMKGYSGNFTASTGGLWGPAGDGEGSTGVTVPTLANLTTIAENTPSDLHFGSFLVGWYDVSDTTWQREGGHFLAIVGTSGSNTVVINNPYPNEGMPIQQTILLSNIPDGTQGESDGPPFYDLGGFLNASNGMQYPTGGTMPPGYNTPVIEQWLDFTVPLTAPGVATWHLDAGANGISIGLGHQDVLAPVADSTGGASSLEFSGGGQLTFTREATYTGGTSVSAAVLASTVASDTPFGAGNITLTSATLALAPAGSGGTIALSSGGGQLAFHGGSMIELTLGGHTSFSFTVDSFFRAADGTLVIATPDAVPGGNVKLLAQSTAPGVNAGMVSPAYVGQNSVGGFFLTYNPANGFLAATTTGGDINSLPANSIYEVTTSQTLAGAAAVTAIEVNDAVTGGAGSSLTIGAAGLEGAGIVFNGGSLSVETVAFGGQTGYIYTGTAGGAIASTITGNGAEGVNFFGPGTLALSGTLSVTGPARVQAGTVSLASTGAISSGSLIIGDGATLEQEGAVGSGSSAVAVSVSGIRLGSGNIFGDVTVQSNGTFSGAGTVIGTTGISGTLTQLVDAANPASVLTFDGNVTINNGGFYYLDIESLADMSLNDFFQVNGTLTFAAGSQMGILFNSVDDPSAANPFWNINQTFLIASATDVVTFDNLTLNALDYANGYFWIGHEAGDVKLHWAAVPEPGTWGLILLGCGLLAGRVVRKRL